MNSRAKSALRLLAWTAGLGLVALLIWRTGPRLIARQLVDVGPRFLWLVGAYFAGTALGALPWRWLLPADARPRVAHTLAGRFAASGFNALFPLLGAGEACRLLWLPRSRWWQGVAAIVVDRLLFSIAGAALLGGGLWAALWIPGLPPSFLIAGGLIALAILGAVLAVAGMGRSGRTLALLRRAAHRLHLPATIGELESERIDATLAALLRGRRRVLVAGLAWHVAGRACLTAEIYFGLRALNVGVTLPEVLVFAAIPVALSIVGTFIPSQLGVQEAVQGLASALLGIGAAVGVSLVLLMRVRQILFVSLAGVLIASAPSRRTRPR